MKNRSKFFIVIPMLVLACVMLTGMGKPSAKKVFVKTLKNGHYQLIVNGKPYIVKGACYNPIPIGKSNDHDFWSDPRQPWKKDGELMKKMGINTVRFYHPGEDFEPVKKVVSDLYKLYGIRTAMGNWLEFWNYPAPFYDDKDFRDKVKKNVLNMVKALKNEEGMLCWILGNENNYSFSGKVNPWSSPRIDKMGDPRQCMLARAESYYTLINEIAVEIHRIDPDHPVVMGNGELICLDIAKEYAKDIDIIGCVIYRGKTFGNFFNTLKNTFDKPVLFIEFGADAYNALDKAEDENMQAMFLESQWSEIYKNLANNPAGVGNCLGGTLFEWTDEWWKHQEWDVAGLSRHDTESNWSNGSYYHDIKAEANMNMNEEWFGIVRVERAPELLPDGGQGLDIRIPRKAFYVLREFWKKPYEVKSKTKSN